MGDNTAEIRVFSAVASAPTALAAFDRALQAGGAHDLNLISLSSVVPVGARVTRDKPDLLGAGIGDRLYCVMAEQRATEPGTEAWAALGWAVDKHGRGGVFVEAHGHSERHVRFEAERSLATLIEDRTYLDFDEPEFEVAGGMCEHDPISALVLAAYEHDQWRLNS